MFLSSLFPCVCWSDLNLFVKVCVSACPRVSTSNVYIQSPREHTWAQYVLTPFNTPPPLSIWFMDGSGWVLLSLPCGTVFFIMYFCFKYIINHTVESALSAKGSGVWWCMVHVTVTPLSVEADTPRCTLSGKVYPIHLQGDCFSVDLSGRVMCRETDRRSEWMSACVWLLLPGALFGMLHTVAYCARRLHYWLDCIPLRYVNITELITHVETRELLCLKAAWLNSISICLWCDFYFFVAWQRAL